MHDFGYSWLNQKLFGKKQEDPSIEQDLDFFGLSKDRDPDLEEDDFDAEVKAPPIWWTAPHALDKGFVKGAAQAMGTGMPIPEAQKGELEEGLDKIIPTQRNFPKEQQSRYTHMENWVENAAQQVPMLTAGGGLSGAASKLIPELIPGAKFANNLIARFASAPQGMSASQAFGRGLVSEALGDAADAADAPWWVKTGMQMIPFVAPDITKELQKTGKTAEFFDYAKRAGMTDAEIAPILKNMEDYSFLEKISTKFASKSERLKNRLGNTWDALSRTYDTFLENPNMQKTILGDSLQNFRKSAANVYKSLPTHLQAEVEPLMKKYLVGGPLTGDRLTRFYKDLNYLLGENAPRQIGRLKQPIMEAMESVNPGMAREFGHITDMYSTMADVSKKLHPGLFDKMFSSGKAGAAVYALGTGNRSMLLKVLGGLGAGQIADELLTNPKFKQITTKMMQAANQGKYGMANNMLKNLTDMMVDKDLEAAIELKNFDFYNLEDQEEQEFAPIDPGSEDTPEQAAARQKLMERMQAG